MSDPFAGDSGDFPIATWMRDSMYLLINTTYNDQRRSYMAQTNPLPSPDMVSDAVAKIENDFERCGPCTSSEHPE